MGHKTIFAHNSRTKMKSSQQKICPMEGHLQQRQEFQKEIVSSQQDSIVELMQSIEILLISYKQQPVRQK